MSTIDKYRNIWIPAEALSMLELETGSILDVGGGAAPYWRASHILDIQGFDARRLQANAWGRAANGSTGASHHGEVGGWTEKQYTRCDLCSGGKWPFADKQFDLGLASHCLEDLRDPLPAVRELARVCRRVLVITPSRLLEQTMGIDHPAYCGFYHHPWMVFGEKNRLVFRRKTQMLCLPGCHIVCPLGKTLGIEHGSQYFVGDMDLIVEERVFWKELEDYEDYRHFIEPYRRRRDLFVSDGYRHDLRYLVRRIRQKYFGVL